jgi:hypothetical protein
MHVSNVCTLATIPLTTKALITKAFATYVPISLIHPIMHKIHAQKSIIATPGTATHQEKVKDAQTEIPDPPFMRHCGACLACSLVKSA